MKAEEAWEKKKDKQKKCDEEVTKREEKMKWRRQQKATSEQQELSSVDSNASIGVDDYLDLDLYRYSWVADSHSRGASPSRRLQIEEPKAPGTGAPLDTNGGRGRKSPRVGVGRSPRGKLETKPRETPKDIVAGKRPAAPIMPIKAWLE